MKALLIALALTLALPAAAQAQSRRAAALAQDARAAFSEGRYEDAAALLLQAYEDYPEPNFIWNTARAYEQAGQFDKAEGYYRQFASLKVEGEDRAAVEDKLARYDGRRAIPVMLRQAQDRAEIGALRQRLQALPAAPAAPPPVIVETSSPSLVWWGGWTATGLGAACLLGAGILHVASLDTVDEYHQTAAAGTERAKYDALKDTLQARVAGSQLLLGSGLLLTLAGGGLLAWELFWSGDEGPAVQPLDAARPGLRLQLSPTGAALSGEF
jgi:tetratricopeptide (TPR) repeat protein